MNAHLTRRLHHGAHAAPDSTRRWAARLLALLAAGLLVLGLLLFSQPARAQHTGPGDAPAPVALRTAS